MSQFTELLKRRIAETEKEYQVVTAQRQELIKLEQRLIREISGYKAALEGEQRRSGDAPATTPTEQLISPAPAPNGNGSTSVIRTISDFVRHSGEKGISRREVAESLEHNGIKVHKNYPYVAVAKLKTENVIEERNGRLYAKN